MRADFVRERLGRRALGVVAAGLVVTAGAPVLAMGVMAGLAPAGGMAHDATPARTRVQTASLVDVHATQWMRVLPAGSLTPTPGAAALAGLGLVVAFSRRRS